MLDIFYTFCALFVINAIFFTIFGYIVVRMGLLPAVKWPKWKDIVHKYWDKNKTKRKNYD